MNFWIYAVPILVLLQCFVINAEIELVDDNDLMHLLTQEENIVVLFTKNPCEDCANIENTAEKLEGKFKEYLGADLVKAHNSQLLPIYNPSREESLIYFRKGIPLLYYGDWNEEEIMLAFSENREPIVKELSDENFEHLTQAATGGTTGDWFVFFTSNDCHLCHRLYGVWEAVGSKLKQRLNVARVNRLNSGISTAKRFGITTSPKFIFIRQGKFYSYKKDSYSPKDLIEFASGGYKNEKAIAVQQVSSLLNDLAEKYIEIAYANQHYLKYALVGLTLLVFIIMCRQFLRKPKPQPKDKKKK